MTEQTERFIRTIKIIRDCLEAIERFFAELDKVYGIEGAAGKAAGTEEKKKERGGFERWQEERAREFPIYRSPGLP